MQRIILAIFLAASSGCAGSYKASYVTGAVAKQFATESYDVYSGQFNKKLSECDPATNDSVTTKSELDECMTPSYEKATHDKIKKAAEVYKSAAVVHTEVMISVDSTKADRLEATRKVLEAAMEMLTLFPDGEALVKKLKSLTGAK